MSIMKSLDHWRSYFRSCSSFSDIFEIIDHAIMVAASDSPKEFKLKRDSAASKESKLNSSRDDIDDHGDMDVNRVLSNYSFGEAEALTDEMKEQSDAVLFELLRRLQLMEAAAVGTGMEAETRRGEGESPG
ncbi:hypothetical protein HN51_057815 [Arachis hypogaea]